MLIISFIVLYIIAIAPAIFLADKFNKTINKTIPLSLIYTISIMYIFGLINQLKIGIIFVIISSSCLLIYTIISNFKKHTIKDLKEKIITNGSKFFTLIFFVFLFVTLNRELTHWDQFSYWSLTAKDMFNTDKMILSTQAVTIYPPVPTILQYLYMKILGGYIQGIEVFTTWILGFAFLLPLFEKTNGKKISNILIGIIILCVPAVFSMLIFYESSYPDALLGIIIGYILCTYFFEKDSKFKIISISASLMLLTLTKSIGIVIATILFIMLILYKILSRKTKKEKIFNKENIKEIFIYAIVIIITFLSWNIYSKVNFKNDIANNTETGNISEIVQSINTTVLGIHQEDYDKASSNGKLLEKLYNVTEITTPVQISAMGVITIFLFVTILYYYKTKNKVISKNIFITIFLGLVLYIVALQFAYLTQFSTKEMLAHDGLERYIATYLLALLYVIVYMFLDMIKEKNKNIFYILLASIIVMITPLTSVANATITSGIYNIEKSEYCDIGRWRANEIKNKTNENDKILGICQDENKKLINLMVRYYMYPLNYTQIEKIDEKNTLKDVLNKNDYDYIYIITTDNYLNNELYSILGLTNIEKDTLYKIEK